MPRRRSRSPSTDSSSRSRSRSRSPRNKHDRHESKAKKKKERREKRDNKKERKQEERIREAEEAAQMLAAASSVLQVPGAFAGGTSNQHDPSGLDFKAMGDGPQFEWVKKRKMEEKMGMSKHERERRDRERRREAEEELKKLKRQREEREQELELFKAERERLQRDKEMQAMGDWYKKEEYFHLEQAKMRSVVRLVQGRPLPIDVLVAHAEMNDEEHQERYDKAIEDHLKSNEHATYSDLLRYLNGVFREVPVDLLEGLNATELVEALSEIQFFKSNEPKQNKVEYWRWMELLFQDQMDTNEALEERPQLTRFFGRSELKKLTSVAFQRGAITEPSILRDIHALLADKTADQLDLLKKNVDKKLSSGVPVDVEYWDTLLKALEIIRARVIVSQLHTERYTAWLDKHAPSMDRHHAREPERRVESPVHVRHEQPASDQDDREPPQTELESRVSPMQVLENEDPRKLSRLERRIDELRSQGLIAADTDRWDVSEEAERLFQQEAARDLESDEEVMQPTDIIYERRERYDPNRPRLRRPRYYNRIQTGYEWTKFNRTHYDVDNPPPKVVQGYKFNIFYPDLYNKSKIPTYTIHDDPEAGPSKETVILRFSAGAPYEDVAFRIVNQPWEYLPRHGFRCVFDRGTLQLWFRFKRLHFRR